MLLCVRSRSRLRACVLRVYATIERRKRERENKNIARAFDVSSLTRSYIKNIGGNPNEVNFVTAKREKERKNDSLALARVKNNQ